MEAFDLYSPAIDADPFPYYEVLRDHGFPTAGRVIPTARLLAIGATDEEADEVARAGASWTVSSYSNPSKRAGPPAPHQLAPGDPVERYMKDVVIRGGFNIHLTEVEEALLAHPEIPHGPIRIGFTPEEALMAATKWGGEIMGMGDELGLVKENYLADLLLVDGDPTQDITLLQDPAKLLMIMKDGAYHKPPPERRASA